MISAENFSSKSPPNGVYEWSPSLEKAGRTITYWELRLASLKTGIGESARLMWLQKSNKIDDNGDINREFIKEKLLLAWKALRQVQRRSI